MPSDLSGNLAQQLKQSPPSKSSALEQLLFSQNDSSCSRRNQEKAIVEREKKADGTIYVFDRQDVSPKAAPELMMLASLMSRKRRGRGDKNRGPLFGT